MDLSFPFVAGLLGSLHCAGMCGPIVLACAAGGAAQGSGSSAVRGSWVGLAYNAGRVVSYTLLGALVGLLGGMIASLRSVGPLISIVSGVVMVVSGLLMLDLIRWPMTPTGEPGRLRQLYLRVMRGLLSLRTAESSLYVGMLTPFLPCGLLYAMFARAAATQSPFAGALTMLAFGLGMVPALLLAGVVSSYLSSKVRLSANRLAAAAVIVMGLLLILRGAGIPLPFMGLSGAPHHGEMPMEGRGRMM